MKKLLSLMIFAILCIACSKDDNAYSDASEIAAITTSTSTIVDFEAVNPTTEVPSRAFDNSSNGMYHGIVVTQDVSVHGKIWVNVANNGTYNATVVTNKGEQMAFYGTPSSRSQEIIAFEGKNGAFTYDVSDFNAPVATNVTINGIDGYVQTVKDRSEQRAAVVLGTYSDTNDAAFAGTWDLMSDGTTDGNTLMAPNLTQVCIVGPGGTMFIDNVFEPFDFPCVAGATGILPVLITPAAGFGDINEFWAQNQSVSILGIDLSYILGQSSTLSQVNNLENTGFVNNDSGNPPIPGCFPLPAKAIWDWNGRIGTASFDDPFDGVPISGRNNPNAKVDKLYEASSSIKPQPLDFPVFK